ncbi:GNAT family N-acetyltransferase [Streptomyces sp. WAC 06738]|uniref:GNAT family N-acetyltransferase n=1 Tax=Streptomyces sp. WAC 06738 TaxID=2203210 RepID=UPI000F6C6098|nr:GNAT family N-acetyltransferase [Streptomyces sp. WAC 06738]AZM47119.1 GNAT family N-acetyltransferase [Streptomyces sp. WAC 06738]
MELKRHGHAEADDVRSLLLDIHDEVYADHPDPFHSRERFTYFLDLWSSRKNWRCVSGWEDGSAVGYAYGAMLAPGGWWKGSERRRDLRGSVFALSELMVLPGWRGTGRAKKIHDALIGPVAADMVSLQVETAHAKVICLYESWGYEKADEFASDDDSPPYTVMVKKLSGAV